MDTNPDINHLNHVVKRREPDLIQCYKVGEYSLYDSVCIKTYHLKNGRSVRAMSEKNPERWSVYLDEIHSVARLTENLTCDQLEVFLLQLEAKEN